MTTARSGRRSKEIRLWCRPRVCRIIRTRSRAGSFGSFEVRFTDGRPSRYFYFDDVLARRLRPEILCSDQALEQAKALLGPSGIDRSIESETG